MKKLLNKKRILTSQRNGCEDIWNAYMVQGAIFSEHDIPMCLTTVTKVPACYISYVEAKAIYKKETNIGNLQFHNDAFVHFYCDDQKFDSDGSGIWTNPYEALDVLSHFGGVITPDFSMYSDFPDPLKRWNTYRMRAFGYWLTCNNILVINNCRWGTEETWEYCFDGLPQNSILFIGAVASGLKKNENHPDFDRGFEELVKRTKPHTIITYGATEYFRSEKFKKYDITFISIKSDTDKAFERRKNNEII